MGKQKLMLFNGFLGSGKTTTMVATAKYLAERGVKVSLITNDLGENLIDTRYAKLNRVPTREIPNGCLCHDVEGFVRTIADLLTDGEADYVFAEPVGSCVGLVESVYKELAASNADFELCPFVVVVDPERYRSIVLDEKDNTFNEEATYMYLKQLAESDIILLNKCDTLTDEERERVLRSLKERYPGRTVVPVAAVDGSGYADWTAAFTNGQQAALRDNEIDWDYLEAGDEHMGWYNNTLHAFSADGAWFDAVVEDLMSGIRAACLREHVEIAHLKILAENGEGFAKAALTGTTRPVVFSERLGQKDIAAVLYINIRAIAPPEQIRDMIYDVVRNTAELFGLRLSEYKEQAFGGFEAAPAPTDVCVSGSCDCCCG